MAKTHPDWALGFQDQTWWSRVAQPRLLTWTADGPPLRVVEQTVGRNAAEATALACYGVVWRGSDDQADEIVRIINCPLPSKSPWLNPNRAVLVAWQAGDGRADAPVERN